MQVFTVDTLDTWVQELDGTDRDGNPVTVHKPVTPVKAYARWLRTTDDPDAFAIKIDLQVTRFGDRILSQNPPRARQWVERNCSEYPADLDNSRIRDIQQMLEYVLEARSGPVDFATDGGTFEIDRNDPIEVNGFPRMLITATIETPDTMTLTIEESVRITIDTRPIR